MKTLIIILLCTMITFPLYSLDVNLSWIASPEEDVIGYYIYYSIDAEEVDFDYIAPIEVLNNIHEGRIYTVIEDMDDYPEGTILNFGVRAFDRSRIKGEPSDICSTAVYEEPGKVDEIECFILTQ